MPKHYCNINPDTNKPISAVEGEPTEEFNVEIPQAFFEQMHLAKFVDGVWEMEDESNFPTPVHEETQDEKITRLEGEIASANDATLTAMSALADVFEMVLALQDQIAGGSS